MLRGGERNHLTEGYYGKKVAWWQVGTGLPSKRPVHCGLMPPLHLLLAFLLLLELALLLHLSTPEISLPLVHGLPVAELLLLHLRLCRVSPPLLADNFPLLLPFKGLAPAFLLAVKLLPAQLCGHSPSCQDYRGAPVYPRADLEAA